MNMINPFAADTTVTEAEATAKVKVSDRAAARIARILYEDSEQAAFRVSVSGGGCSGFQYQFALVQAIEPDDLVIRSQGATVVVDPVSLPYLEGAELDLVDNLMGEAFAVNNPQATASCGCGTSFSV